MLATIRSSSTVRLLWACVTCCLLNFCIKAEVTDKGISFDPAYPQQESLAEYLAEQVFGYEHTYSEQNDNSPSETEESELIKTDLINSGSSLHAINFRRIRNAENFPEYQTTLNSGFFQLFTPPPRA